MNLSSCFLQKARTTEHTYSPKTPSTGRAKGSWGLNEAHVLFSPSREQLRSCQHTVASMINYSNPPKPSVTGPLMTHCTLSCLDSDADSSGFKRCLPQGTVLFPLPLAPSFFFRLQMKQIERRMTERMKGCSNANKTSGLEKSCL